MTGPVKGNDIDTADCSHCSGDNEKCFNYTKKTKLKINYKVKFYILHDKIYQNYVHIGFIILIGEMSHTEVMSLCRIFALSSNDTLVRQEYSVATSERRCPH